MIRWLCLICAFCGALAAQSPTPRQCFETFMDAVLNRQQLAPEARKEALERCFDFDAWAADKETTDNRKLSDAEKTDLRAEWSTLLASDEFARRWQAKTVTITSAPEPVGAEATLEISLGEQRGQKFLVKLRRDATDFWRWYAITPLDQIPGENPVNPPQTAAQKLAAIAERLAELDKLETGIAAERAALLKQRRDLQAQMEEERGGDATLGSPRALAEALARAMNKADWGAVVLAHAPGVRREAARARFDAACARVAVWTARQAYVREAGVSAMLVLEMRTADGRTRMIVLQAVRSGDRWWINEEP